MTLPSTDIQLPQGVMPIVPMRNVVLFPHVLLPITVGREKSVAAVLYASLADAPIGIVLQRDPQEEAPGRAGLHNVGTIAKIARVVGAEGAHHAICQGVQRFKMGEMVEGYPFLAARYEPIDEADETSTEVEALGMQLRERAVEVLSLLPGVPAELSNVLQATRSPAQLADITAGLIDAEVTEKQQLLEAMGLDLRLQKVLALLSHRLAVLRLSHEIGERTKEELSDRQRKYLLREQLKTIQKELGEEDEQDEDIAKLSHLIAQSGMPPDIEAQARKELDRLKRASEAGAENAVLRTYLEWMTELPWREPAPMQIDIEAARRTLEADHFGLEMVKRRILEFLAVKKLNPLGRAPILCFVGPPGVGKTSLGQSIAKALQRPFVRVSLGGVHDEAEIRGHRRTYIGSLPGNIIQGLRKAGARDCVMMLDEVDKMSPSVQGDPSAAMLEVLDPEQNSSFRDNYLGVPFDLSRVTFIATANVMDPIPGALRDRMEVIDLPGYTLEEKLQIARTYLLPRQLEVNGLKTVQCQIPDTTLKAIVADYTREAGVRQLEREMGRVMRHVAVRIAQGDDQHVIIEPTHLDAILGAPKFQHEVALRIGLPGVATGLAWTPSGGDILFIEATRVPGHGKLILTGQLGDVMKESAQAALTLVKSRAAGLRIGADVFDNTDVHLHVPAGAIPKDGPSAGVAMFIALTSLFINKPVRHDVAMTGEISLRGLVLPVGGIKEKVLAAQRAGLTKVMLPARNEKDLRDVPESARQAMHFVLLQTVDDAIRTALTDNGAPTVNLMSAA